MLRFKTYASALIAGAYRLTRRIAIKSIIEKKISSKFSSLISSESLLAGSQEIAFIWGHTKTIEKSQNLQIQVYFCLWYLLESYREP